MKSLSYLWDMNETNTTPNTMNNTLTTAAPAMPNVQTLTNAELKDLQRTAYNASLYANSDATFELFNAIATAAREEMAFRIG